MLDLRRLEVLHAVAREGSMSAAATALAFTPSAVSQQVAALERAVGTSLVTRRPRGVVLTEAGRLLVDHADAVLERLARAQTELAELTTLRRGRLRLAAFPTAGARLLPDAVGAFRRRHPNVRMSMEIEEPADCPERVLDGRYDLAVVFDYTHSWESEHPDPPAATGLRSTWLLDDVMNIALPADHRLAAAGVPLEISELRDEPWVRDSGPVCSAQLGRLCATAGYRPNVAFDTDDYPTVDRLVAAGVGVALVPDLAADQMGDGVVLRPAVPSVVRRISALVPTDPSPAAAAMLELLTAHHALAPTPA